ncbi:hypothetical protein C8Q79DRAFT_550330 [Trametes meyenii]|nr:hypothetical protein C8Q79DRAFT_550330 [Trametes meyenii]
MQGGQGVQRAGRLVVRPSPRTDRTTSATFVNCHLSGKAQEEFTGRCRSINAVPFPGLVPPYSSPFEDAYSSAQRLPKLPRRLAWTAAEHLGLNVDEGRHGGTVHGPLRPQHAARQCIRSRQVEEQPPTAQTHLPPLVYVPQRYPPAPDASRTNGRLLHPRSCSSGCGRRRRVLQRPLLPCSLRGSLVARRAASDTRRPSRAPERASRGLPDSSDAVPASKAAEDASYRPCVSP